MTAALPPLVYFQSLWLYLFALGLFNCLFALACLGYYLLTTVLRILAASPCSRGLQFPSFWGQFFPAYLTRWQWLLLGLSYLLVCLLEAGVLFFKSRQALRQAQRWSALKAQFLLLAWPVRAGVKNLSGLFFLCSGFALPAYRWPYLLLGFLGLGFVFWAQLGSWQGFALAFNHGKPRPQISTAGSVLLFWASLGVGTLATLLLGVDLVLLFVDSYLFRLVCLAVLGLLVWGYQQFCKKSVEKSPEGVDV